MFLLLELTKQNIVITKPDSLFSLIFIHHVLLTNDKSAHSVSSNALLWDGDSDRDEML